MQNTGYRHILLVCKSHNEEAMALGQQVATWLVRQGYGVVRLNGGNDDPAYQKENFDLAVVLGGDGTMLGVARRLAGRAVPLFGINFGRVGFLTNARPDQWRDALTLCLNGGAQVRHYMGLLWTLARGEHVIASGYAVNDVVLGRGSLARLVSLEVFANGHTMGLLRGDGVIFATPLGSSGYCISAGGPLLYPGMDAIAYTPVCPFLTETRPMVLPGETKFSVRFVQGAADCYLTIDGQEGLPLEKEDTLSVVGAPSAVLLCGDSSVFFERLRSCGFIMPASDNLSGGAQ